MHLGRKLHTVCVVLDPGVKLTNIVDTSIFNGVHPEASLADAKRLFGAERANRMHPEIRGLSWEAFVSPAPRGEIVLFEARFGDEIIWEFYSFPSNSPPEQIIRDASLLSQVLRFRQPGKSLRVAIEEKGYGIVTIKIDSNRVDNARLGKLTVYQKTE